MLPIIGTPPDYENHYPSNEDKIRFIQQYLKEKTNIMDTESCEAYDEKLKLLYVQVCKCELVRF